MSGAAPEPQGPSRAQAASGCRGHCDPDHPDRACRAGRRDPGAAMTPTLVLGGEKWLELRISNKSYRQRSRMQFRDFLPVSTNTSLKGELLRRPRRPRRDCWAPPGCLPVGAGARGALAHRPLGGLPPCCCLPPRRALAQPWSIPWATGVGGADGGIGSASLVPDMASPSAPGGDAGHRRHVPHPQSAPARRRYVA